MGAACSGTSVKEVLSMSNRVPFAPEWSKLDAPPGRFTSPIFTRVIGNKYSIQMGVKNGEKIENITIQLPVLTDLVECLVHPTYQLKLLNQTVVDVFDLNNTQQILIQATHKKTGVQYSLKVYGCSSYMDESFERGLYEVYLHKLIGHQDRGVVNLVDAYIIDRSQFRKTLILLFEPLETSLANVLEYRKLAQVPWTYNQQQAISKNILNGMHILHSNGVAHRDIRPSNIFFSAIKGEYVLGNLYCAERLPSGLGSMETLMPVCGVMLFNSEKVNQIIRSGDRTGFYSPILNDCVSLGRVLSSISRLQFVNFINIAPEPVDPVIRMLEQGQQALAYTYVANCTTKIDEGPIIRWVQLLLTQTNLHLNQKALLSASFYMMFSEDFSKLAHQEIQKNILNEVPFENAFLYMRLAQFYVNTGADPQQYFINAFSLYLRKAQKNRKRGHYALAIVDLQQAKRAEGFITPTASIAFKTELAVVKSDIGDLQQANLIMAQAMRDAANVPLAPEAQLMLLLSKGHICIRAMMFAEGMRFLQYGLQLSQSVTNFTTRYNQRRMKSCFHLNLGRCLLSQIRGDIEPIVKKQVLAEAESHLLSALEIRESDKMDELEISEAFDAVADLYLQRRDYYLASKALTKSLNLKQKYIGQYNPLFLVPLQYQLGNCHFQLKDNNSAEQHYRIALQHGQQFPNEGVLLGRIYYQLGLTLISQGNQMQGAELIGIAKQSLAGLLATNDATVLSLNQQVTKVLSATGVMPPDIVMSQMGMGMMGAGGMGNIAGMMMASGGMNPGLMGSMTRPFAPNMGGSMMGGSMLRGSMGMGVMPMGTAVMPQQLMGSNAITPMTMSGSLVTPFGGGMGLSIR